MHQSNLGIRWRQSGILSLKRCSWMASVARHRIALLVTVILCLTGLVILARAREHSAKHAHAGKAIEIMVQEEIANHRVIIFSKSYCPYCMKAKRLFKDMGVPFKAIEMDLDGVASARW